MTKIQLEMSNLVGRKYVQGSYIIRGVVEQLASMYDHVQAFDLRIHAPLYSNAEMVITDKPMLPVGAVASGSCIVNEQKRYYYLSGIDKPITNLYEFDEPAAEASIALVQDYWTLRGDLVINDPFIGWSVIERSKNLDVFASIDPPGTTRKMWFTGIRFNDLSFLKEPLRFVQSTIQHKFVTSTCICRAISYNGFEVGQRFAVGKVTQ
jgi:hypothetical protein